MTINPPRLKTKTNWSILYLVR